MTSLQMMSDHYCAVAEVMDVDGLKYDIFYGYVMSTVNSETIQMSVSDFQLDSTMEQLMADF